MATHRCVATHSLEVSQGRFLAPISSPISVPTTHCSINKNDDTSLCRHFHTFAVLRVISQPKLVNSKCTCQKYPYRKTGPVEFPQPVLTTRCFPRPSVLGKKFREHLIVRFTGALSRSRTGTAKMTSFACCRYTIRAPEAMCTASSPVVRCIF